MAGVGGSQTVDRALELLDALTNFTSPPRLSDLSESVGLNISTTSRLLASLDRFGYVRRDKSDGRYRLGYKILYMATVVQEQTKLHQLADDVLQELVDAINETSGLSILHDNHVMVVARATCRNQLRLALPIGTLSPVHCTAAGKSLLAHQSPEYIDEVLSAGLPKMTEKTITDREAMLAELATVRERGYALDLGEREVGLIGISVPVHNMSGAVTTTCTASGSQARITPERIPEILEQIQIAAAEISYRLGWRGGQAIDNVGYVAAVTGGVAAH